MSYLLNASGASGDNEADPSNLIIPDAVSNVGTQAQAMQQGTAILCQRPDGSQGYYRIDAERSIPGQPPVLIPLGP